MLRFPTLQIFFYNWKIEEHQQTIESGLLYTGSGKFFLNHVYFICIFKACNHCYEWFGNLQTKWRNPSQMSCNSGDTGLPFSFLSGSWTLLCNTHLAENGFVAQPSVVFSLMLKGFPLKKKRLKYFCWNFSKKLAIITLIFQLLELTFQKMSLLCHETTIPWWHLIKLRINSLMSVTLSLSWLKSVFLTGYFRQGPTILL